jgi:hypothetical protein
LFVALFVDVYLGSLLFLTCHLHVSQRSTLAITTSSLLQFPHRVRSNTVRPVVGTQNLRQPIPINSYSPFPGVLDSLSPSPSLSNMCSRSSDASLGMARLQLLTFETSNLVLSAASRLWFYYQMTILSISRMFLNETG